MNITFAAHCVGHTLFGEENRDASISLIGISSSYERAQVSFIATVRPRKSSCSLWYRSTRPVQLHSGAIVPRKFHGVSNVRQVCGNPKYHAECGAEFCALHKLLLLTHMQFNREARSWTVLFSMWRHPVWRLPWYAFLPSRNALTHRATVWYSNATSPHASHSPRKQSCVLWPRATSIFDPGMFASIL